MDNISSVEFLIDTIAIFGVVAYAIYQDAKTRNTSKNYKYTNIPIGSIEINISDSPLKPVRSLEKLI